MGKPWGYLAVDADSSALLPTAGQSRASTGPPTATVPPVSVESAGLSGMWTSRRRGVVSVGGIVDLTTLDQFASAVRGAIEDAGRSGEAHLNLVGLDFIDVSGACLLVAASVDRAAGNQLVLHHPPSALLRILDIGWGSLPGLRSEP